MRLIQSIGSERRPGFHCFFRQESVCYRASSPSMSTTCSEGVRRWTGLQKSIGFARIWAVLGLKERPRKNEKKRKKTQVSSCRGGSKSAAERHKGSRWRPLSYEITWSHLVSDHREGSKAAKVAKDSKTQGSHCASSNAWLIVCSDDSWRILCR